MGLINVSMNGRPYDIACDDGQEDHVALLAEVLNDRVTALARTVGQVGEARLLLMAGLLVTDELIDARSEVERLAGDEHELIDTRSEVERLTGDEHELIDARSEVGRLTGDGHELIDARSEVERHAGDGHERGYVEGSFGYVEGSFTEAELVEMINGLAQRIEDIAARLKST